MEAARVVRDRNIYIFDYLTSNLNVYQKHKIYENENYPSGSNNCGCNSVILIYQFVKECN